jgi:hopanoid C-2 methylase
MAAQHHHRPDDGAKCATLRSFRPGRRRRILCISPRYASSFGTFNHAFPLVGKVKAFMPPQGLLLIAALVPAEWDVEFVDENIRPATDQEFAWADAVFISGMHIQRARINDINDRAHRFDKLTVLGGPSVSAAPEFYPTVDVLHCGEVGDATRTLLEMLDRSCARPPRQLVLRTVERLAMSEFPVPAYRLIQFRRYLIASIQFSSGCPFTCEFCDIPGLYGRNPRLKTPQQVVAELDQLADGGAVAVYFVDDNFFANPRAALDLLPHIIAWQKRRGYLLQFACEATLNIGASPKLLELMREAKFFTMFCGIETPEAEALRAMHKEHNLRRPILEVVDQLNRHGIEVAAGIILGLDTDDDQTADAVTDFTRRSNVPILTVNLLYALPRTPLHDRLAKSGRLNSGEGRDSNIEFLRGYDVVHRDWRRVVEEIYSPSAIYARYAHNCRQTFVNRWKPENGWARLSWSNILRGVDTLLRMVWHVGIKADYRRHFWSMAWRELRLGNIESIFHVAINSHHLILNARECLGGKKQASNYSHRVMEEDREAAMA